MPIHEITDITFVRDRVIIVMVQRSRGPRSSHVGRVLHTRSSGTHFGDIISGDTMPNSLTVYDEKICCTRIMCVVDVHIPSIGSRF
jgi:hypothetical protein